MIFPIGAALLDACVLAELSREDMYGYLLTQNVCMAIEVSESTLYPVLRRLQKDKCLTTYDMEFQGRNRRYYRITEHGRAMLGSYRREWANYKEKVEVLLLGGLDE